MKGKGIVLNEETGDFEIKVMRDRTGMIKSGLVVGDTQKQNQAFIINMYPGELKEHPTIGVGISSLLLSHETLLYKHRIREQLEADGFNLKYLELEVSLDNKITVDINANY